MIVAVTLRSADVEAMATGNQKTDTVTCLVVVEPTGVVIVVVRR